MGLSVKATAMCGALPLLCYSHSTVQGKMEDNKYFLHSMTNLRLWFYISNLKILSFLRWSSPVSHSTAFFQFCLIKLFLAPPHNLLFQRWTLNPPASLSQALRLHMWDIMLTLFSNAQNSIAIHSTNGN